MKSQFNRSSAFNALYREDKRAVRRSDESLFFHSILNLGNHPSPHWQFHGKPFSTRYIGEWSFSLWHKIDTRLIQVELRKRISYSFSTYPVVDTPVTCTRDSMLKGNSKYTFPQKYVPRSIHQLYVESDLMCSDVLNRGTKKNGWGKKKKN